MVASFLLYFILLVFILLARMNDFFFYLVFFILIFPLIVKKPEDIGLKNIKKGFFYGFLSSLIYFPFIWNNVSIYSFSQIGQVFGEELFFRGYLFNTLRINNPHLKNIVISGLFTIPHIIVYTNFLSALTFFPSLIFGYLYIRTGSIIAPAIFHLFSNIFFQNYLIHKL